MTAAVRVYSYSGVVSAPIKNQNLATTNDAFVLLVQPYLAREVLSATASPVATSATTAPTHTNCLVIEVETGKTIAYEVTPANADLRTADTDSPRITGRNVISFGAGDRLSVVEVSA